MKNVSLSLFAFHLYQGFTNAPDEVFADAAQMWENLAILGHTVFPFPGLQDLRSKLSCYQGDRYDPSQEKGLLSDWLTDAGSLDLGSIPTREGFKIQGNLQPFRLNDTYAVDLTLTPDSPHLALDVSHLQHFHPHSLLPGTIQASLGETLWLYAEVDASEDTTQLAEKLAVALLAKTSLNPILLYRDTLFDSLLFEYQALDASAPNNPAKQAQILICLNPNQAPTRQLTAQAYDWLLRLLCSRHKLYFIYQEAYKHYPQARQLYSRLEQQIQDFPHQTTDDFKKILEPLPQQSLDFLRCLRDWQAHHTSLIRNTTNYRICYEKVRAIGDTPSNWQDFLTTCQIWQAQIETDINYFSPGRDLFNQTINIVRVRVEIEQVERDRSLEATLRNNETAAKKREQHLKLWIALFGTGLAVSGVSSQVNSQPLQTFINNLSQSDMPVCPAAGIVRCAAFSFLDVFIHILVAVIITLPVGIIIRQCQKH